MNKIICPNCSREYLPGEIYLPKHFTGQPTNVSRDVYGKIVWVDGYDQDLEESFICEGCGKKLKINARIDYKVELDSSNETNKQQYVSNKYTDRLFLNEDI